MKYFFSLLAASALVFQACEKNVTIDVPRSDPKLVVDAWVERDKPLLISIGNSRHILDPRPASNSYLITNAKPILMENAVAIDTLVFEPAQQRYRSPRNRVLRAGFTYTLSVEAPGYKAVEARTGVPSPSSIAGIARVRNARVGATGEVLDEVTIKLNDPAAETNFYLIRFYTTNFNSPQEYPIDCVNTSDKDVEAMGADPSDPNSCFDGSNILVKDANFNGREKVLRFFVGSDRLQEYTAGSGRKYRPYVRVYRITEDHFRYLKSYSAYSNSEGNPFAEPVNLYSNVRNGHGIFSAFTAAVDSIR